jgi:hypothetical protein
MPYTNFVRLRVTRNTYSLHDMHTYVLKNQRYRWPPPQQMFVPINRTVTTTFLWCSCGLDSTIKRHQWEAILTSLTSEQRGDGERKNKNESTAAKERDIVASSKKILLSHTTHTFPTTTTPDGTNSTLLLDSNFLPSFLCTISSPPRPDDHDACYVCYQAQGWRWVSVCRYVNDEREKREKKNKESFTAAGAVAVGENDWPQRTMTTMSK